MARWKLINAHYLMTIDPAEWEYTETSRTTGKQVRKKFHIPRLLDPSDPGDWTNRWGNKDNAEGEVVVCLPDKGQPGDVEFLGDPTPDMSPIDDEAKEISASFAVRWSYKPDSDQSYSQSLVDKFQVEMAELKTKAPPLEIPGLADLVAAISQQTKATSEAIAALGAPRRV